MRVDLHSHTMWSGDSTTTPDEVEQAVVESGIDVLCVTDHNAIRGAVELAERLPCRVIVGEELRTHAGEIIGLFLTERVPVGTPPAEAAEQIRAQGGMVYIPHPFDPMRRNLAEPALRDLADARPGRRHRGAQRQDVAAQPQRTRPRRSPPSTTCAGGAGSDAHVPDALGAAYVEMPDFDGPADFLDKLRGGRVVGHHWDQARPWSARILPGTTTD